jgi:hypothetical protein
VLSLDPEVVLRETLFTDSDGAVEVADARGLSLRIVTEAPGFPRRSTTVDHAPATVPIKLEAGVILEGTVTAAHGRSWVEGAQIALISEGARRIARTDSEGRFRIADVAPGSAHLHVVHPDYASRDLDVKVTRTGRTDRPQTLEPIDLQEPGSVEGRVVDGEGEPVAGARVASGLVPAFLPTGTLPPGVVQTDENGLFFLGGLAPGKHTLDALSTVSGRGRATGVDVTAGRVTDRVRIVVSGQATDDGSVLGGSVAVTLGERGSGGSAEVVVVNVAPSSEAERAGLSAGDLVLEVDGRAPTSMADARERLSGRPGTDVVIEVRRDAHTIVLRVQRELVRK